MKLFRNQIYTLSIAIALLSCKSKQQIESEKLESNLKTFYIENFKDSSSTLDSFRLITIDTITQKMLLAEQSSVLTNQLGTLLDFYELNTKSLSNSVDQMRLYRLIESNELLTIAKNEAFEKSKKLHDIKMEIDSMQKIIQNIEDNIVTSDTINAIGFQAKCFYQIRRKDKSVKQDTTYIILNLNKDVQTKKDFLKLPYIIDFNKFNK